jgi:hypothetical protein
MRVFCRISAFWLRVCRRCFENNIGNDESMKKVVDANALRSPELLTYLQASSQNKIVLTDYLSMESFKGNSEINIRKSLEVIRGFSKQVIVLKTTGEISLLRPKKKGLHKRFIDEKQTQGFEHYWRAIFGPQSLEVSADIKSKGATANAHLEKMLIETKSVREGISALISSYKESDLKDLRSGIPISKDFSDRIRKDILMTTMIFFKNFGYKREDLSGWPEITYSYPFRYAVCGYVLALKWIADSGHTAVAAEKLRNDCVDMTYAAHATFFDGLITNDKKAFELYRLANWMLLNVFVG